MIALDDLGIAQSLYQIGAPADPRDPGSHQDLQPRIYVKALLEAADLFVAAIKEIIGGGCPQVVLQDAVGQLGFDLPIGDGSAPYGPQVVGGRPFFQKVRDPGIVVVDGRIDDDREDLG